jgi:glucan-binding YG repeat protein
MGASLCWYNNWEKSGVGIGASNFSKYGAGNTKRYFTTLRTDSDIVMIAQNGVLTVQKGAGKWTYTVPYKGEATSGWKHGESGWWYQYEDGTYAVGWKELPWSGGKDWFYFNKNGIMLTGWYYDEGLKAWYYLDPETGRMLKNGPINVNGYWYYLDGYGRMRTGWYDPGDGYRYLEEDPAKNLGHMYVSTEATIEIHATKKFVFDGYGIAKEVTE